MSEIVNARINKTELGFGDHGIMTCWLFLEGDGWGCGFGGYALDNWDGEKKRRVGTVPGFEAVIQILITLEVESWEELEGQYIRCETNGWGGKITKIGHLIKDKWFSFDEFFAEQKEKNR